MVVYGLDWQGVTAGVEPVSCCLDAGLPRATGHKAQAGAGSIGKSRRWCETENLPF